MRVKYRCTAYYFYNKQITNVRRHARHHFKIGFTVGKLRRNCITENYASCRCAEDYSPRPAATDRDYSIAMIVAFIGAFSADSDFH